jgi:superkiller protein 3
MFRWSIPWIVGVCLVAASPVAVVAQSVVELNERANAAFEGGNYKEAEQIYREIIEREPNHDRIYVFYNNLGNALLNQGKREEAIENYRQALQINPDYAQAYYTYYNLGRALYEQGKREEAIENYRQALQINPDYAYAYNNLGIALSHQGKREEAIENYRQALQINPDLVETYNNLGNALRQQGKLQEAIDNYREAIQLNPDYAHTYVNLGVALMEEGQMQEAIENFRQALSLPDVEGFISRNSVSKGGWGSIHAVAYNNWGLSLQKQGNLEAAIEKYKRALEIDPNFTTAQYNLDETQRLLAKKQDSRPPVSNDTQYVPSSNEEPLIDILRSTAKIVAHGFQGFSIGTGWVVKRQGDTAWLVTNRHVVSKSDKPASPLSDKIEVEFYSDLESHRRPRYQATVVEASNTSSGIDLAVLKVTGIPQDIKPLNVQLGRVPRLTEVAIVGHPYNVESDWSTVTGEVTNYNPENAMLVVDATLAQGNSGGPIISRSGNQVVGLMTQIRDSSDIAANPNQPTPRIGGSMPATGGIGLAYRMDFIWNQLQEWGILDE